MRKYQKIGSSICNMSNKCNGYTQMTQRAIVMTLNKQHNEIGRLKKELKEKE